MEPDDRPTYDAAADTTPRGNGAPDASTEDDHLIVAGIGASAGGIEALRGFFEALPDDLGVAYVVIMHLSPEHRSHLPEILRTVTAMPVMQVHEPVPFREDHVYVIPPNRRLVVKDGTIAAVPFEEPRGHRVPIDTFFRSYAEAHGDGFAILFSGGGTDGTVGLKAVKEAGGLVLVQDPAEAEYASMPRSAIATGLADLVLPVRDLAEQMPALVRSKRELRTLPEHVDDEQTLRDILTFLCTRTGHDFSQYKRSTVLRRLARRMQVHHTPKLADYLAYLRTNVEEAQALFQDLLISVTTFFRDADAFVALAEDVIPRLFEDRDPEDPIRVWVPGCATGEEAYSLAILLLEEARRREVFPKIQVFASDLDVGALATAREGRYPAAIRADVSDERLDRFFEPEGDHYRVCREVRDCVLFATHSLLRDSPFSRLDLVSCRNLLIYLDRDLQHQAFGILHYALRPGGFVFLGSSEVAMDGLFRPLDKEHRIYQAREHAAQERPPIPSLLATPRIHLPPARPSAPRESLSEAALHRKMLEDYAPPSALVDAAHRVVHLSETAGRFLQPPGGTLTNDLTALVRPELQLELRAALHRAFAEGEPTLSPPVAVRFDETARRVHLVVRLRPAREGGAPLALVVFVEGGPMDEAEVPEGDQATDNTVRHLGEELRHTRHQLRDTRDEADTSNEELRATNEELQSINEEYRSTTEELETSKEELQSINEELETVNNELKNKLDEVSRAHSDLQNLMTVTEVGTLFLDLELRIKRYTPRVADLFNVTENDRGRPITDFTHRLDYPAFVEDARTVLTDLASVEHEVQSAAGRWYLVRMRPYRTVENTIDGVVVTFVEFTTRKEAEEALRQSEERYRLLFETVEEYAILTLGTDGRIASWNSGAKQIFGWTEAEIVGRSVDVLFTEEDRAAGVPEQEMATTAQTGTAGDDRWHVRQDGSRFWASGVMTALRGQDGSLRGFAKVLRDNTERKEIEETLRVSEARFREMAEAVPDILFTAKPGSGIDYVSRQFEAFTGVASEDVVGPGAWLGLIHEEDRAAAVAGWEEAAERRERFEMRYRLQSADGGYFWVIVRARPVLDAEGALVRWFGTLTDINALTEAEAALRRLTATLEERVRERTEQVRELAYTVTMAEQNERHRIAQILHDDLQQLLFGIQLKMTFVQRGAADAPALAAHAEESEQFLQRAIQVSRQLTVDLSPPVLAGEGLVDALEWLKTQMAEVHHLRVEIRAEQPFDIPKEGMRVLLFQVIRELLFNVVKHAGIDHATVRLEQHGEDLVITVEDGGDGFDPEAVEREAEGGFGLFSARERLRLFGGHLEIHSVPGDGARIVATIPVSNHSNV